MSKLILKLCENYLIESNQTLSRFLSINSLLNQKRIDKSKVPILNESDLKEEYIHGSGPGGQNVNKLSNCVQLTHLPTGIVVKCHQNRYQHRNRIIARELLTSKLDDLVNGDQSVNSQRHRLITDRFGRRNKKREKLRNLKTEYNRRAEELKDRSDSENDSNVSRID